MNLLYSIAAPLVLASSGSASAIPAVPTLSTIPTIPTLGSPGPLANGIVALDDGTVFFVDSFNRTVWRLQAGATLDPFVTGRNGRSLYADDEGHLYGTHEDQAGRVVTWRADANGKVVDLPHPDVPQYGHAFVVEDDGDIIASSGTGKRSGVRLVRSSDDERELLAGGEMGFRDGKGANAMFLPIGGMTRTPDGDLLVTSGASIRRVSRNGSVQTIAKGERLLKPRHAFLARLFGQVHGHLTSIAVGAHGEIYVANGARNAVIRIHPNGSADEIVRSDDGWTPTGVAAAGGMLYILEYGRGVRVRRVDAAGMMSTVAVVKQEGPVASAWLTGRFIPRDVIG